MINGFKMNKKNSEIIIYQTEGGKTKIQVRLEDNTVWLTQADMVELFQSSKSNICEHIKHILEEGELQPESTVRKFRTVRTEGNRQVERKIAQRKALAEYEAYKNKANDELSEVEKQFIASIEQAHKKLKAVGKTNKKR